MPKQCGEWADPLLNANHVGEVWKLIVCQSIELKILGPPPQVNVGIESIVLKQHPVPHELGGRQRLD